MAETKDYKKIQDEIQKIVHADLKRKGFKKKGRVTKILLTLIPQNMKRIVLLFLVLVFLINCKKDDGGCAVLFGYCCEDCRFVNLLDSCDDTSPTRVEISCAEYERLADIRQNNTTACIAISVNPSNGGDAVEGFGKDWFFDCD